MVRKYIISAKHINCIQSSKNNTFTHSPCHTMKMIFLAQLIRILGKFFSLHKIKVIFTEILCATSRPIKYFTGKIALDLMAIMIKLTH